MINSVNGLEFLKPKLINMDKFNCPATTKLLPPSSFTQTRTFVTISGHHQQHLHHYNNTIDFRQENQQQPQQQQKKGFLLNNEINQQERVRVQHLENPTELQNNKCWNNFRTLNYTSASSGVNNNNHREIKDDNEIDVVNVEHLPLSKVITPTNIQNKSAFNLDLNNKKCLNNNNTIYGNKNNDDIKMDSSSIAETNNNNYQFYNKQYNNCGLINNKQSPKTGTMNVLTLLPSVSETQSSTQRTEDQNNAYRHIESVHNYAKSKSYEDDDDDNQSPNGSRHSSYLDDDEDEDDDDDDEDIDQVDAVYDNDDDIDYEQRLESNVDVDYEHIFNRRQRRFQKLSTSSDGALLIKSNRINHNSRVGVATDELIKSAQFVNDSKNHQIQTLKVNKSNNNAGEEEEIHVDIDVETVESQSSSNIPIGDINSTSTFNGIGNESSVTVKPDHHARRPMNAFLIFCKRHRAIVKERYKNLENRAITKILGDWWASLDVNDKKCFTNLAQQNKDAFFSANPNFKWYKLPAPPLRTLTTRPANAFGQEYQDDNECNAHEIISNNTCNNNISNNNHSNYFKLADEAQMGDLSQLMQDRSKTTKQCADLQQALGETSQFMSAHITGNADAMEENHLKRRFHNENSFSSNSSEEDVIESKKKSARSCKGKRYQELVNSGQIATVVKKSKSSVRLAGGNGGGGGGGAENTEVNVKQNFSNVNNFNNNLNTNNVCQKRSVSECDNIMSYDINGFDLEERIKELPALNLDDYLQRKRNTKKKKKFSSNGKKRGQRNSNSGNNNTSNRNNEGNLSNKNHQLNESLQHKPIVKQHQQTPPTAVGSQKRKARKESITRRDVSAIEQEVASLLPLTINGCCYFQEAPTALKFLQTIEKDSETTTTTPQSQSINVTSTSPIIPLQKNTTSTVSIDIFNNTNICNNNCNNNSLNDNISSSTSDLLILAEVAANRTEL